MFFGEGSLLFISCNLTPGFTSLYLFRLKELLCLLRPRPKYPQKSLAPMYQRCDNAYDVKQHFTANGPGREFARDVRAQILGVMVLLLGPARQVMAGDRSASSRPDHLFLNIFRSIKDTIMTLLGLGPFLPVCHLFELS